MAATMNLLCSLLAASLLMLASPLIPTAHAQSVVRCESIKGRYTECDAPWPSARLLEQNSRAACVAGSSWGFNAASHRLWVSQGCRALFAPGGRTATTAYPRGGTQGQVAVSGAAATALLDAVIAEEERKERERLRREANAYNGCNGVGCYVDNPEAAGYVDPGSEIQANPDYDANGNYIGCSGVGCYITHPDAP
jgi:hypothetical protein